MLYVLYNQRRVCRDFTYIFLLSATYHVYKTLKGKFIYLCNYYLRWVLMYSVQNKTPNISMYIYVYLVKHFDAFHTDLQLICKRI